MRVLIKEKLSPNKYKTPEGYLVCVDAILARTGKQQYRRNELYVDSDDDSIVDVDRPYDEVFSEQTIASFENKPFVNEHPNEDVNVHNHKDYAVGFVRDVHKGEVDGEPVLLGNLIITDEETIAEIESGEKTELSCGYDCDITDDENPCQRNIRGNHVALCKAGRAGIARIQDSQVEDSSEDDFYDELFSSNLKYEFIKGGYGIKFKTPRDYQKAKEIAKRTHYTKGKWYDKDLEFFEYGGITISNEDSITDSKWYAVYGEESGWMKEFKTLSEAKKFIKEVKSFDKREGIEDEYYIEVEVHDSVGSLSDSSIQYTFEIINSETNEQMNIVHIMANSKEEAWKKIKSKYAGKKVLISFLNEIDLKDSINDADERLYLELKKVAEEYNLAKNGQVNSKTTKSDLRYVNKKHEVASDLRNKLIKEWNSIVTNLSKTYQLILGKEPSLTKVEEFKKMLKGEKHKNDSMEEMVKDKLQNKPVKVRIKFESNQEANDALKMLCKKEQFTDCDLIFDDTVEVKTTDVYVDDLKKALRLYFVKKIEVKDSIKDTHFTVSSNGNSEEFNSEEELLKKYKKEGYDTVRGIKAPKLNGLMGPFFNGDGKILYETKERYMSYDSEELVEDGRLIEPEQQHVKEFERMIQRAGFKIDRTGKTISGRLHYQVITNQKGYDEKDLKRFSRELEKISNTMRNWEIPMTYNIGLQYDGYISAGIDLDKQWVEDSIEDTNCQDEAIYMYIADPDDDKDIIYEAKHYGLKLEKFGGLIKVIGTLTQIAKTLKMLPKDVIAYSNQPRSVVKKVRDKSVEDLKVNSMKYINIIKKVKEVKDSNLGKSKLKIGQKVHLDPTKNSRASKEALEATYEIVGFWYDGKLVTQDPVTKQEYLDMSGVLIKNVSNGVKSSVNRFQLMDSKVKDGNLDFIIYSNPKGVSEEREDEVVAILKKYGSVKHTMISGMNKFTLNSDVNTLNKALKELSDKKLIAKLSNGAGFIVKADIRDSKVKDSVYKIKTFNNKWYYEETREDGYSNLVGPFKTSAEARAALQKHRPNVKVRHLESGTYYDAMELSAKTSEELDNLMKQYQKKHPTWKFSEIRKDKGLYRCSVVKN